MPEVIENAPVAGAGFVAPILGAGIPEEHSFDSESEEALRLRYGRIAKDPEPLVYEFTRDPALLHQYYRIREQEFKTIYTVPRFSGEETEHDRKGQILIVRRGNLCIGGVRLFSKTPRKPDLLPLEIKDFRIEDHFPQLKNREIAYGQASWFSLLSEYHGTDVAREMQRRITQRALALGLTMCFAAAPLLNARLYKQNCIANGFKDVKIHFDIPLPSYPSYEELKLYLISWTNQKSLSGASEIVTDQSHLEKSLQSEDL